MTEPAISAEQFEREYAERSGLTVEQLREYRVVVRCQCEEGACQGWASMSPELAVEYEPGGFYWNQWN